MITRAVNKAYQEDEAIKRASEQRSKLYLDKIDKEKDSIPNWLMNLVWFVIGGWFVFMVMGINWIEVIKAINF